MDSDKRYYTTHEVSQLLGVSLPAVINWVSAGRLRAFRTPGGHRRIEREDLIAFIRRFGLPMPDEFSDEGALVRVLILAGSSADVSELEALIQRADCEALAAHGELEIGLFLGAPAKPDALLVHLSSLGRRAFLILSDAERFLGMRLPPAFGFSDESLNDRDLKRAGEAGLQAIFHPEVTPVDFRARLERAFRTVG